MKRKALVLIDELTAKDAFEAVVLPGGAGTAVDFVLTIAEKPTGKNEVREISDAIVYD